MRLKRFLRKNIKEAKWISGKSFSFSIVSNRIKDKNRPGSTLGCSIRFYTG
jgi:hypothetical protein